MHPNDLGAPAPPAARPLPALAGPPGREGAGRLTLAPRCVGRVFAPMAWRFPPPCLQASLWCPRPSWTSTMLSQWTGRTGTRATAPWRWGRAVSLERSGCWLGADVAAAARCKQGSGPPTPPPTPEAAHAEGSVHTCSQAVGWDAACATATSRCWGSAHRPSLRSLPACCPPQVSLEGEVGTLEVWDFCNDKGAPAGCWARRMLLRRLPRTPPLPRCCSACRGRRCAAACSFACTARPHRPLDPAAAPPQIAPPTTPTAAPRTRPSTPRMCAAEGAGRGLL